MRTASHRLYKAPRVRYGARLVQWPVKVVGGWADKGRFLAGVLVYGSVAESLLLQEVHVLCFDRFLDVWIDSKGGVGLLWRPKVQIRCPHFVKIIS